MPALVVTRVNPHLKAIYQTFITVGKPPKAAITIGMRKFFPLANILLRDRRKWNAKQRLINTGILISALPVDDILQRLAGDIAAQVLDK